jgi:hypothetical protein
MNPAICIPIIQPFVNQWGTRLQLHPEYPIIFHHPYLGTNI